MDNTNQELLELIKQDHKATDKGLAYETAISQRAMYKGLLFSAAFACVLFLLQIIIKGTYNIGIYTVLLASSVSGLWFKQRETPSKDLKIVALISTILLVICTTIFVYTLFK